jgi:lysophospholipase L1-like esterase
MSTGDLGAAPALPWPVAPVYSARSRAVRDRFLAAARDHGVDYVDLFSGPGDNGFRQEAERYYARDGLHLSGAGYGTWYDRLTAATALPEQLQTR